jgi:D-sedoheptulose 7-phosphate isomerase
MQTFAATYLAETATIVGQLPSAAIEEAAKLLRSVRKTNGRVFCIGVGGSAATASHAAADLRNLCSMEAYALDSMADLTATVNDYGWDDVFRRWLRANRLCGKDCLLVFSVGGGSREVSPCVSVALECAVALEARIIGIVGRDGGRIKVRADVCILIPTINPVRVTPHVEEAHAIVLHLLVSHPALQVCKPKWESL